MITKELTDFIKKQLQLGLTKEKISSELLANGWGAGDVEEGFRATNPILNLSGIPTPSPVINSNQNNFTDSVIIKYDRRTILLGVIGWALVFVSPVVNILTPPGWIAIIFSIIILVAVLGSRKKPSHARKMIFAGIVLMLLTFIPMLIFAIALFGVGHSGYGNGALGYLMLLLAYSPFILGVVLLLISAKRMNPKSRTEISFATLSGQNISSPGGLNTANKPQKSLLFNSIIILIIIIALGVQAFSIYNFYRQIFLSATLPEYKISDCDNESNSREKNYCYFRVAMSSRDLSVCDKMTENTKRVPEDTIFVGLTSRDSCYTQFASANLYRSADLSICEKMENSVGKNFCYYINAVSKDDCNKVDINFDVADMKGLCLEKFNNQ